MKPSVLITRRVPSVVLDRFEPFCETDLYVGEMPIEPGELLARVHGKQGLVCVLTDKIDRDVIDAESDLSVIANIAVGFDNIDVRYARDRQIAVTNTPDVLTESVAEFTWGLILAVSRRISEGERLLRAGNWRGWALDFLLGDGASRQATRHRRRRPDRPRGGGPGPRLRHAGRLRTRPQLATVRDER